MGSFEWALGKVQMGNYPLISLVQMSLYFNLPPMKFSLINNSNINVSILLIAPH